MTDIADASLQLALPGHFYVEPAIYALERDRVFLPAWHFVGKASTLPAPGDYRLIDVAGVSLIVIRDEAGNLRAYQNMCRHRGSRLLDEARGNCDALRCPYHDWRYQLDGQLAETPWFGDESPFDFAKLALVPAALEVWRDLLFVSVRPAAALADQLGDLPGHLVDAELEQMVEVAGPTFAIDVNWKAYLDQFNEYYHTPAVHAPDKGVGIENYSAEPFHQGMIMQSPPGAAFYGGKWLWAWPNWTISTFSGGAKVSQIMPVSATRSEVRFTFLFADMSEAAAPQRQRVIDATEHIFHEDLTAVQRFQANAGAGMFEVPGPLHPRHERATAYFQRRVQEALS